MGKSSKRREGKQSERAEKANLKATLTQAVIDKPPGPAPPDCPDWGSYHEALFELKLLGWKEAQFVPQYPAQRLAELLNSMLDGKGITVDDKTACIPEGANGDHTVYQKIVHELEEESKKNVDTLFTIVRTEANTPAFLGGCFYMFMADMKNNKRSAVAYTEQSQTPAICAFFRGVDITLPTPICQGNEHLASKILAAMICEDESIFRCGLCKHSFLVRHNEYEYELKPFLASNCCNTAFHAVCIIKRMQQGYKHCPCCSEPLPADWVNCFESMKKKNGVNLERRMQDFTIK